ncbi:MAG: uL15 family ribosomal protein [archaeon]|nr:uL15 family ribosomal protein [archaeon]
MRLKKKRKSKRMHGYGMGTHGWGARKKHISSGNRGGKGMAGTGKMAGQKKTLIVKLYGANNYFGKQGITSRGSERRHNNIINLSMIERDFDKLKAKYGNKEGVLDLKTFKILGDGDIKIKVHIKALRASKSAIEKIEKAGGKIEVLESGKKNEPKKVVAKAKVEKEE